MRSSSPYFAMKINDLIIRNQPSFVNLNPAKKACETPKKYRQQDLF